MHTPNTVFETTYADYLAQLQTLSFARLARNLDLTLTDTTLTIPFFTDLFTVTPEGIRDQDGKRPDFDICIILFKYLLLCQDNPPQNTNWVTFRDIKGSGPLHKYFVHDVEHFVVEHFNGHLNRLEQAGAHLNGSAPQLEVQYDFSLQFNALPSLPVIILFNDRDEEFPAQCILLFEARVDSYLDPECIGMLGRQLVHRLHRAGKR